MTAPKGGIDAYIASALADAATAQGAADAATVAAAAAAASVIAAASEIVAVANTGVVTPAGVGYVQADQTALANCVLALVVAVNAILAALDPS